MTQLRANKRNNHKAGRKNRDNINSPESKKHKTQAEVIIPELDQLESESEFCFKKNQDQLELESDEDSTKSDMEKTVLSKTLSEGDMNYEDKLAFLNLILVKKNKKFLESIYFF